MENPDSTLASETRTLAPAHEFAMCFTSTRRGARLARRLVSQRLDEWGYGYDSAVNETLTLIAAELSANAVRHGHVPGRDFHLRLTATPHALRVEVSDTRTERVPLLSADEPPGDAESGRGLLLVARLATRWGATPRPAAPGKTVWAELIPEARAFDAAARLADDTGVKAAVR
jgi:anti-sigma regulatory factor (Ser/Thr protein kinase)